MQKVCFPGGATAVQALIGKSVDVFAGSSEHILRAESKGIPLKAYACLQNGIGYTLIAKGDSKYKTIADLKGETRADWVADNKAPMQTLLRTVAAAAAAAKRDPQTAAGDMLKEFPNVGKATMLTAVVY